MAIKVTSRQQSFEYRQRAAPICYGFRTGTRQIDTVVFLGAGQVGLVLKMVVRAFPPGVAVVEGVPHRFIAPDGSDTAEFSRRYIDVAFRVILRDFQLRRAHVVAESQAAPGVLKLAIHRPEEVGNVALIRPLGLNVPAYGNTPPERFRTFLRRTWQCYAQLPHTILGDIRNVAVFLNVWRTAFREPSWSALRAKYMAGVSYDAIPDLKLALTSLRRRGRSLMLVLSERDLLFRPGEILANLHQHRVAGFQHIIIAHSTHASLAVRGSRWEIVAAMAAVRGGASGRAVASVRGDAPARGTVAGGRGSLPTRGASKANRSRIASGPRRRSTTS